MDNEFNNNENMDNNIGVENQGIDTSVNQPVDMPTEEQVNDTQNVQNFNAYQEFNQAPVNNVPNTGVESQPVNNVPVEEPVQQPMNQPIEQPVNNIPNQQPMQTPVNNVNYNQQMEGQPVNNNVYQQPLQQPVQQPMYNNQPMNQPKSSNSKIVIGVIIGIIAALALGFLAYSLLTKNAKGNNNYDDRSADTVSTTDADTITYQGFAFEKAPGYIYQVKSDGLVIGNNDVAYAIGVYGIDFNTAAANKDELLNELSKQGYTMNNWKEQTIKDRQFITIESTQNNKQLLIAMSKAKTGSIFIAAVAVPTYTIDYSKLDDLADILNNSKFTGDSNTYASTLPTEYDIDSIVNNIEFK